MTSAKRPVATDYRIAHIADELQRIAGTAEDIVVAEQLGILPRDVAIFRQRHGVPIFGTAIWDGVDELLGMLPDKEIAEQLGVDPSTVQKRRNKLGFDPYRRNEAVVTGKCDGALGHPMSDEQAAEWLGVQVRTVRFRRAWLKKSHGQE